jgi:predicted lipoprotein with Yx(FWY)xxD motif
MQENRIAHHPRHRIRLLPTLAVVAALIGVLSVGAAAGSQSRVATKRVAKQLHNQTLGRNILTRLNGHTLYSLSAETKGKFICTGSCTSIWHPLTVPAGTKPIGPVTLGTIKRPEGTRQVRYRGLPLYTFASDRKPGQVKGQGIKDVGTWHAAVVPKHKSGGGGY